MLRGRLSAGERQRTASVLARTRQGTLRERRVRRAFRRQAAFIERHAIDVFTRERPLLRACEQVTRISAIRFTPTREREMRSKGSPFELDAVVFKPARDQSLQGNDLIGAAREPKVKHPRTVSTGERTEPAEGEAERRLAEAALDRGDDCARLPGIDRAQKRERHMELPGSHPSNRARGDTLQPALLRRDALAHGICEIDCNKQTHRSERQGEGALPDPES